jgi:hypothetical protein
MSPYEILFRSGAARRQSDTAPVRSLSALYPLDRASAQDGRRSIDVGCCGKSDVSVLRYVPPAVSIHVMVSRRFRDGDAVCITSATSFLPAVRGAKDRLAVSMRSDGSWLPSTETSGTVAAAPGR